MNDLSVEDCVWISEENVPVEKPWGYYEDIFRTPEVVFKKIVVNPGEAISLQRHYKRTEFWHIVQGTGKFRLGKMNYIIVNPGDSRYILPNFVHGVENIGEEELIIYEMQAGVCDENDIVRMEDKYGRDKSPD